MNPLIISSHMKKEISISEKYCAKILISVRKNINEAEAIFHRFKRSKQLYSSG